MISLADNLTLDIRCKYRYETKNCPSSSFFVCFVQWQWIGPNCFGFGSIFMTNWQISFSCQWNWSWCNNAVIEKEVHQQNLLLFSFYYIKMWSIVMIHGFSLVWSRISDYYYHHHHLTNNEFKIQMCNMQKCWKGARSLRCERVSNEKWIIIIKNSQ